MKHKIWTIYSTTQLFDILAREKILMLYNGLAIKHGKEAGMLQYNKEKDQWEESEIMVIDLGATPCRIVTERETKHGIK